MILRYPLNYACLQAVAELCFQDRLVLVFSFYFSSTLLISISFGSTRLRMMETTNTTATTLAENTDCISCGKRLQIPLSLAVVNPIPIAREREIMVTLRCEKPHFAIICTPEVRIEPNIIMVHPPRTHSGRDAKKFPTGGSRPARIMQAAPVIMVKRLTT